MTAGCLAFIQKTGKGGAGIQSSEFSRFYQKTVFWWLR